MRAQRAVGAVVFRDDGAVLLIQRGHPPLEGAWSLPGGRVETGESVEGAVVREVLEETGLAVIAGALVDVVTLSKEGPGEAYAYEIHEVLCTLRAGDSVENARAGDDARAIRWCHGHDFAALGVTEAVRSVIAKAARLATSG
jgi:8-oxo-dGTP diphosphatase